MLLVSCGYPAHCGCALAQLCAQRQLVIADLKMYKEVGSVYVPEFFDVW